MKTLKSDLKKLSKFHNLMLESGVYLAPSQFETQFICDKMVKNGIKCDW